MRRSWKTIFGLDYERSIWIEQEDLGKQKVFKFKNKQYPVTIPQTIDKNVVVRLRGLGRTRGNKTGDLLLAIWLNKGEDIRKSLWLSETSAKSRTKKMLAFQEKKIQVLIPKGSYDGLVIRLKGLGRKLNFRWRNPLLRRKREDLLVKLFVYPDNITPKYGSFEMLSTEEMALEYRLRVSTPFQP